MTGLANALLIRYAGGHVYLDRSGSNRPREFYVEFGSIRDRDTAAQLGARLLALRRTARETIAVEGPALTEAQTPETGYRLGDTVDGYPLASFTATLTGDGYASIVPELGDPLDAALAALDRQIARVTTGVAGEYARPTVDRQDTGSGTDTTPPEWSTDDVLVSASEVWRPPRPWWCAWLQVTLGAAGTTPTRVAICRERTSTGTTFDLVPVATATLAPGERNALARVNRGWAAGEGLVLVTSAAGTGAAKLTASTRGVMV